RSLVTASQMTSDYALSGRSHDNGRDKFFGTQEAFRCMIPILNTPKSPEATTEALRGILTSIQIEFSGS
ncbi:MAG: hypothetical protein RR547_10020, partial [Raoultibacter sp.]